MKHLGNIADAVGGTAAASASLLTANATMPFVGVAVPALVAAVIGTIAGISLGDPIEPRSKLFGHAFAYTFLGAAGASFVPFLFQWKLTDGQTASFAIIVSASMRWLWPALTAQFGPWLSNINPFKRK